MNQDIYNMRSDIDQIFFNALVNIIAQKSNSIKLTMIEVGSYAGQSMELFVRTERISAIMCVDPWKAGYDKNDPASSTNMEKVEQLFDERMKKLQSMASIFKFKGNFQQFTQSNDWLTFNERFGGVDFVYIDALHTYEGVKNDIITALELIKPKTAVCGHDYVPGWPGVVKAVDEIVGQPDFVFPDYSWCKFL